MSVITDTTEREFLECEHCAAPVEPDQRYCINCGAHRAGVPDPAARYLSEASAARARVAAVATARVGAAGRRRPLPRVSATFAVVSVLAAAAAGFGVGRASGGATVTRKTVATRTIATSTGAAATSITRTTTTGKGYASQESSLPSGVAEP